MNEANVYIHLVGHSGMVAQAVPEYIKSTIHDKFLNILVLSGGYTYERAVTDIEQGKAGLIAFGKPFINNPDPVKLFFNNVRGCSLMIL